jgi:cell division protein FtsB
MRRAVRILLVTLVVGGLVLLFVLPGRTWLAQRSASRQDHQRLAVLNRENAELARRAALLQNPAYVEQIARSEYGLVLPGQRSYGILPPTATTTTSSPGSNRG